MCPHVAFHEEMPKIPLKVHVEQHPPSLRPWAMEQENPPNKVDQYTRGGKINLQKNPNEKLSFPDGSQSNPDETM